MRRKHEPQNSPNSNHFCSRVFRLLVDVFGRSAEHSTRGPCASRSVRNAGGKIARHPPLEAGSRLAEGEGEGIFFGHEPGDSIYQSGGIGFTEEGDLLGGPGVSLSGASRGNGAGRRAFAKSAQCETG